MTEKPKPTYEELETALRELAEGALECEAATDIDAGCEGYGPVSEALMLLGDSYETANLKIWGEDWESDGMAEEEEDDEDSGEDDA